MNRDEAQKLMKSHESDIRTSIESNTVALILDKIYDDFESKTCERCIFHDKNLMICKNHSLNLMKDGGELLHNGMFLNVDNDFSCNKWETT